MRLEGQGQGKGQGGEGRFDGAAADLGIGVPTAHELSFMLNVGAEPLVPLA